MGRVYRRGSRWYIDCLDHEGQRVRRSAGRTKGEAEQVLKEVRAGVAQVRAGVMPPPAETLRTLSIPWLARRERKGLRGVVNDRGYLNCHILPELGDVPVADIRVKHIRAFVETLEGKGLAPRTVRHIYAALRKLFADLVVDEVIPASPCVLTRDYLPPDIDRDPEWRGGAVFSREEVGGILAADLPGDRRVLYALLFLTGMRLGEVIGLRWRDMDWDAAPLKRLLVQRSYEGRTKTKVPRAVPIHPHLEGLLTEWRQGGAAELLGRPPEAGDLVLPSRRGGMREKNAVRRRFHRDLDRMSLRIRRIHDTRRTFVTLSRAAGARADVLRVITHTSSRDIIDLYTSLPWETLCEAVACIEVERGLSEGGVA